MIFGCVYLEEAESKGDQEMARGVPAAVLRQPVQAVVRAGRAEGGDGEPQPPRGLADALGCPGGGVATGAGELLKGG